MGGDKSLAKHFQPLAVAAFSGGRLVAAPLFGFLMDRLPLRWVVLSTIGISIVGHLIYVFCGSISGADAAASGIIVARTIVGLGSGNTWLKRVHMHSQIPLPPLLAGVLGMCRAVVSLSTTPQQRTPYFSALSTAKFIG